MRMLAWSLRILGCATPLPQVLCVASCKLVTVAPFAHCLYELNASWSCGVGSTALSTCHRLHVLEAYNNRNIRELRSSFAGQLRELDAGGSSGLSDYDLAGAVSLVRLHASHHSRITTTEPFGSSLRVLTASYGGIGDAGLTTATNLIALDASCNLTITSVAPFGASLLELNLFGENAINGEQLLAAAPI